MKSHCQPHMLRDMSSMEPLATFSFAAQLAADERNVAQKLIMIFYLNANVIQVPPLDSTPQRREKCQFKAEDGI